jgi:hypothetical protein
MDVARSEDPIRAARAAVFRTWERYGWVGIPGRTASELIEDADERDEHGFVRQPFRDACMIVASDRSGHSISGQRLGKWLAKNNNNRVGDLKLTVNRNDISRLKWILTKDKNAG